MRLLSAIAIALFVLGGCAANPLYKEGRELLAAGKTEEGLLRLEQSVREAPNDREARTFYYRERAKTVSEWSVAAEASRAAGRLAEAEATWRRVLAVDPNNPRAKDGLTELEGTRRRQTMLLEAEGLLKKGDIRAAETRVRTILAEDQSHVGAKALQARLQEQQARKEVRQPALKTGLDKPITLDFRDTPLKSVLEVMSRTAGINFVMDRDVRSDTKVTIFVRNAGIEEVLRLVTVTNQLRYRIIGENSVLIYPVLTAKSKEYEENVTRNFYLKNIEAKQAVNLFKTIIKSRDIYVDEKLNIIVLRDTPEAIRLAEKLIDSVDLPEPEVMLEIEVLELTRGKLLELGLKFPDQVGYGLLTPSTETVVANATGFATTSTMLGGALSTGMIDLNNRSGLTSYIANPGALLNLKDQVGDSSLLANPRIRVKNREKAKIHIGEKLPIFTTTSTANVGVSSSVSYLDVGLKLDVEPTVHLDNEVDIRVGLEVSSVVKEVSGPSSSLAYQVGTRTAATILRLRDGETQVLAGLINDEERSSANRLPGLGDLPIIGRLFSSQRDNNSKTEIVLLVTPRVVRNIVRPSLVEPTLPAGTENAIGSPPLSVTGSSGLSLSSRPGPGGVAPAEPESVQRESDVPVPMTGQPLPPEPPAQPPQPATEPGQPAGDNPPGAPPS